MEKMIWRRIGGQSGPSIYPKTVTTVSRMMGRATGTVGRLRRHSLSKN